MIIREVGSYLLNLTEGMRVRELKKRVIVVISINTTNKVDNEATFLIVLINLVLISLTVIAYTLKKYLYKKK